MSDIKVGELEYIRTTNGKIGRFLGYNTKINSNWDCKIDLSDRKTKLYCNHDYIKSHSPNIIDLIECGDYVNGYRVMKEKYNYHNINFIDLDTDDAGGFGWGFALPEEHIKSIVTHEQFDSIKYVVGR